MPETLNLNYYYGNEADQYSFYRIPKILLTDRRYKGVSLEAKVLYGLLLVSHDMAHAPHAKASAQRDNQYLQSVDCARKKFHTFSSLNLLSYCKLK